MTMQGQFADRQDAGAQLAEALQKYALEDAVVLALPRGGVVLGAEVAKALDAPLDIIVARKIGHPTNPEYALCAVDAHGARLCAPAASGVDTTWLEAETAREQQEAARREEVYRADRAPYALEDKLVILVDDGIATGLTIRLATAAVRKHHPAQLVVAVPVAPRDIVHALERVADDVVVLTPPGAFRGAVGAHYTDFPQTTDADVLALLAA